MKVKKGKFEKYKKDHPFCIDKEWRKKYCV